MYNYSHHKVSIFGFLVILLIFVGLIGWMVIAKVDLTIQASGEIIVNNYKKTVAHPKGGVIKKLFVKEGDYVEKGDKLIEIDNDQLISQLNGSKTNYLHLLAEKLRILAELNNKKPHFTKEIPDEIKENEIMIYNNRISNLNQTIKSLELQIEEQHKNLEGLKLALKTKKKLLDSYQKEYDEQQKLYEKDFIDKSKILDLSRKILQLKGDIDNIESQIRQKESIIKELKNKIKLTKSNYRKELLDNLKKINSQLPNIKTKIEILKNEIGNNIIKAPSNGVITDMQIHSAGELVKPGQPILYLVPKNTKYVIEAKVSPMDIDKVRIGEKADVNFPSYVDPAAKPIEAVVTYVSADVIKDPKMQYYKVILKFTPKGLKAIKENNFEIIPGMPVAAFIKADRRSFASYILLPIKQLLKGAFHAN
jgi:epimerase transport system membrane fusion protein